MKLVFRLKGGAGSGNHGHAGIPGHQGGSAAGHGGGSGETEANTMAKLVTASILHNQGGSGETEANAMAKLVTESIRHNQGTDAPAKRSERLVPKAIAGIRSMSDFEDRYHGLFKLDYQVETVIGNGERYYTPKSSLAKMANFALDHWDEVEHSSWEHTKPMLQDIANWERGQDVRRYTSGDTSGILDTLHRIVAKVYDGKNIGTFDSPRWYM